MADNNNFQSTVESLFKGCLLYTSRFCEMRGKL